MTNQSKSRQEAENQQGVERQPLAPVQRKAPTGFAPLAQARRHGASAAAAEAFADSAVQLQAVTSAARGGADGKALGASAVQLQAAIASGEGSTAQVHQAAAEGTRGSGGPLPHLDRIQASFGRHDVSSVQAHVGSAATRASNSMGAEAFATGNTVAFANAPSLHTAAHEAAHVVQQRGGVSLKGGVGKAGDSYERHADAVANLVVQGKSAEGLLGTMASGSGGARAAVQRSPKQTHFGTFTDEKYGLNSTKTVLHMTLKFMPNNQVDADKIGLTQSKHNTVGGTALVMDPNESTRMTASGHIIDRLTDKNTPIYGSEDLPSGKGLEDTAKDNNTSGSKTELNPDKGRNATYELGHRKNDSGTWKREAAGLYDGPTVDQVKNGLMEFETAAVALAGTQKDTYYGSVKWGWKTDNSGTASEIPFDVVSKGVPSKNFLMAADKFNAAKTRGTVMPKANGTKVYDGSLSVKFTIDQGVEAKQKQTASAGADTYVEIEITSAGTHHGKTGYVKVSDVKDKGDGDTTVNLPPVAVKLITASTDLFSDHQQTSKLQSLAKDTRVKVLATQGAAKQIEVVDGSDTGKKGWVAAAKLKNE